jgi:glutathione S-transferase
MRLHLYVVHGSHPYAAVEKAMAMKGLAYEVTGWPPPLHAPIQRALFGARTVPGLKIDGEKVSGSRAIMRRLEQLAPEPPLSPPIPTRRVEEAERWGDDLFIAHLGGRLNRTGDGVARSDLDTLPRQLDRVDAWIADGTIGDRERPNAADLQLASTLRLMLTLADVRPLIEGRPCARLALRLFPEADGELPAGSLPAP